MSPACVERRSQDPTEHRPTLRVLDVLDELSRAPEGCTLTDLSHATGVSKSTLVPILKTMESRRFITFEAGTGRYSIGIKAFSVGSSFVDNVPLVNVLRTEMERMMAVCKETCQLGVLDGGDVLYIAKVDSPQAVRLISSIGKHIPAYCTALGKALLCDATPQQIVELFPEPLKRLTSHTISSVEELTAQIAEQRATGIFSEFEESSESVVCFSVPLRQRGRILAAVSVSLPRYRLDDKKERGICHALLDYQRSVEQLLETYPDHNGLLLG